MKEYMIISDGSCDLSDDAVEKLGVRVVPFYIAFENETYLKEKKEVNVQEFYQKLIEHPNIFPKTSMPTAQDYMEEFLKAYQEGYDVLCITISKKFSGSLNSALMARDMFLDEYPDARVEVVDSTVNSCTQGLLVREVARMKENGLNLDETLAKIEEIKGTGRSYFTINGLSYLQHGGRIGKLTAIVGNIFKVTPLIVQKDGEIQSGGLALSRKRAIMKIFDKFKDILHKHNLNIDHYQIVVGYGQSLEEGKDLATKFESIFGKKIVLFEQIGATIAVHTGPYPLGIAFIKKYDVE